MKGDPFRVATLAAIKSPRRIRISPFLESDGRGEWPRNHQLPVHDLQRQRRKHARRGTVVDGPAPRMLPALPLKIVDGKLVVAKPFTARVGFEPG